MGRITIELLRKKAEHNEGELHSLEELSLHQEKIERIELLESTCRRLRILLLQNNVISKIGNLSKLKSLEYLNLALNNIRLIEGLEGCESLTKLDLTLNFISHLSSVKNLAGNSFLEELYLMGNPCAEYKGYRDFVVAILPQLRKLDGREVVVSERIAATQKLPEIMEELSKIEAELTDDQGGPQAAEFAEMSNDDFWKQKTADTPEMRSEMARRLEAINEEKNPKVIQKAVKTPRKLFKEDGSPYNINEPKLAFSLAEDPERNELILDLAIPKYMDSSLLKPDVHPNYVRVTIKGKMFQMALPQEVLVGTDLVAQRSKITGHLVIRMVRAVDTRSGASIPELRPKKPEIRAKSQDSEAVNWRRIIEDNKKRAINEDKHIEANGEDIDFEDDPSVPPLI